MKKISVFIFLLIITYCCICFAASFPYTLNYQGMLTNKTGQPVTEPQDITFNLYTTPISIGSELPFWTETLLKVPVSNGQFSVTLGTVTTLDPSKFGGDTYLGIKVGTQAEMLPRQKMTSVPYAFNGVPQGGIIMWSGTTVPVGWALCNGNNGTPDLRDRFIVGAGNSYTVGGKGGESTHVITGNEMPPHDHGGSTGVQSANHTHNGVLTSVNRDGSSGSRVREADPTGSSAGVYYTTGEANTDHTHTVATQGGGVAFDNRPLYYALAFIMKL